MNMAKDQYLFTESECQLNQSILKGIIGMAKSHHRLNAGGGQGGAGFNSLYGA